MACARPLDDLGSTNCYSSGGGSGWRWAKPAPQDPRLLDIGTHDGTVFRLTGATGVGIDPELIEACRDCPE